MTYTGGDNHVTGEQGGTPNGAAPVLTTTTVTTSLIPQRIPIHPSTKYSERLSARTIKELIHNRNGPLEQTH